MHVKRMSRQSRISYVTPTTRHRAIDERSEKLEGKIDSAGTGRGETPVCTRFGAAQRGLFAALRIGAEARPCCPRCVSPTRAYADLRPNTIKVKRARRPGS